MVDPTHYAGRGQALVKHTFLERYIRDQIYKVGRFGTFAYVDLFAGPWQSQTLDYSDTSFGIVLRQMATAKAALAKLGTDVRMIAHLVEKENFAELAAAAAQFPSVEVHCHPGRAEDHADAIAAAIPTGAFRFVAIDPKGLPDIREFEKLIAAPRTEVLLNFMFQFANRFVATNRMPRLVEWLSSVAPGPDWQARVDGLSGEAREQFITDMAREALAKMGDYKYRPAITVDETDCDRPLYKLIFLTRHELGLQVFRDAEAKALEVQAATRIDAKAAKRQERTGMVDMLAQAGLDVPSDRSATLLAKGRAAGAHYAMAVLEDRAPDGVTWKALWTEVLDAWSITHKELRDAIAAQHKAGRLDIFGLQPPARKPKNEHVIALRVL